MVMPNNDAGNPTPPTDPNGGAGGTGGQPDYGNQKTTDYGNQKTTDYGNQKTTDYGALYEESLKKIDELQKDDWYK